jgi:FMN phosphatase YigB (HAD superfamily)
MVGNNLNQDIAPANEANMRTAQVKFKEKSIPPTKWPRRPNYVIYNIDGVLEIAGIKA